MKNRKISIEKVIMIFLIVIIICMFFVIMNMKNKNIEGQKIAKEQLGEATTDNSYILMSTHMSALDEKQKEINNMQNTAGQATVTADKILKDYTAYKNGQLITGTMANNGAVTKTLNAGGSYTIPAGYHNGSGKVTANSLANQTSATATAGDIISGKTAWVNGTLITGNATNIKPTITYIGSSNGKSWSGNQNYTNFIISCTRARTGFSISSYSNCTIQTQSISTTSSDEDAYTQTIIVSNITGTPTINFSGNGAQQIYFLTYGIK